MKHVLATFALAALFAAPSATLAQAAPQPIISTYRVAPGHQVELLKWLAQQDSIAEAAGVPKGQLYAHANGASWDYLVIQPPMTPQQEAAVEAAAKKMNLPAGPAAGIELRKHIAEHTDTTVAGPMSAADYLKRIGAQ